MCIVPRWRYTRCAVKRLSARVTGAAGVFLLVAALANARDLGQWGDQELKVRQWFESIMVPNHPMESCCGAADAYWADEFEVKNGQYVAIVTDTRPDAPLQREHIDVGTHFVVPNSKITTRPNNPTGHGWIFVIGGIVFCYLPPTGA